MGCTGCARTLLIVFNFIFWLSGAAILGVGIWLAVDKDLQTYLDIIHIETTKPYFIYSAYLLIGFGAFVFVVGFLGCCGALRRNQGLLGIYIFFLLVVMAGELAAGILAALYKKDIETKLKVHLMETVKMKYNETGYDIITDAMNYVQVQVGCCGVDGPMDYRDSAWHNNSASTGGNVPPTCCLLMKPNHLKPMPVNYTDCQNNAYGMGNQNVHSIGCYDGVLNWFREHIAIIIGLGCGIAGLELFGLLFAICLCRDASKEEEYE